MRLTYSHVYSHENKYNLIVGNAFNNPPQKILQFFVRLFVYSHKDNIKMFRYYSHNILEIKERSLKYLLLLMSIH